MKNITALLCFISLCMNVCAQMTKDQTSAGGCLIIEPTAEEQYKQLTADGKPTYHQPLDTNSDWEISGLYSLSEGNSRVALHNIKTDEMMTLSPGNTSNGITVVSIAYDKNSAVFLVGTNEVHWTLGTPDPENNE